METVIYLKTSKVFGYHGNGLPKIEKSTVKLESVRAFPNFIRHISANKYTENPIVEKVIEIENGKINEIDVSLYQDIINKALKKETLKNDTDYKKLAEDQAAKIALLEEKFSKLEAKSNNESSEENELSNIRELLEQKANELNITFRSSIGDKKLLAKIQEIEQDFEV